MHYDALHDHSSRDHPKDHNLIVQSLEDYKGNKSGAQANHKIKMLMAFGQAPHLLK